MICSAILCNADEMADDDDLDTEGGRLRWARLRAGYGDAAQFARIMKMHPTTYRAYENNQNSISKHAPDFAERLGVTTNWLLRGGPSPEGDPPARMREVVPKTRGLPRDLPVFGTALAANLDVNVLEGDGHAVEQVEINMTDALDYMARPVGLTGRADVYVVTVAGYSMIPRHDMGRRLLVNPAIPPMIGDDVVVQLKRRLGEDGEAEMSAVLVKQLVRRRHDVVILRQFNPDITFEVPMEKVHVIQRIQPWDEALGF